MNGVVGSDEDCSEFVELDPTGRYGRVSIFCYSFSLVFQTLFWCSMFVLNLGSCCLHMFEFNLINFDAFCSIMKFWARELQRQCMISIPFSILSISLSLFVVKVCIFIHCCALVVADIEPLMSMKGLKWHGTK